MATLREVLGIRYSDEYQNAKNRENRRAGNNELYEFMAKHIGSYIDWHCPEYIVWKESREVYFPFISVKQPGLISFTKNIEHLLADRQTMMKLSKYLRFIGILDNEVIKRVQDEYNIMQKVAAKYQFATGMEIAEIYQECSGTSVSSCMSYDAGNFPLHSSKEERNIHPTEVYDTPDVKLAYLRDDMGIIKARSLINVPKKQYSSVYGHNSLALQLEAEGYEVGDLDGVKLKLVSCDNGTVCPYIDGSAFVDVKEDHLLVSSNEGEYNTHADNFYDNAYLEYDSSLVQCIDCNDMFDEDNTIHVEHHGTVCDGCRGDYIYARSSEWGSGWVHQDDAYEFEDEWYTSAGLNNFNLVRDVAGDLHKESDVYEHKWGYYTLEQLANADLMLDDDGDVVHIDDYTPNDEDDDDESDDVSTSVSDDISFIHDEMVIHTARPAVPISVAPDNINEQYQRVIEAHMRAEMDMHRSMLQGYWFDTINTGRRSRRRS